EVEVAGIGVDNFKGQLTAWNYFQSIKADANAKFVASYQSRYGANQVTDDPIEHAYSAVYLWAKPADKAKSIDVDKVRAAANGLSVASILLLVAIGLAITFGLMNVINMAHGQFIMVGGYVAYVCSGLAGLVLGPAAAGDGFLVALPMAFLVAAGLGWLLERGL